MYFFCGGKQNQRRRGGKYHLEKECVFLRKRKRNREVKRGKFMEKGNILCGAKKGGKQFDVGEE